MEDSENSDVHVREYWNKRAEIVEDDESIADFLSHLRIVDQQTFQIALPTLCIVSAKEISEARRKEFEEICANVLLDVDSTRPSRRAALACLKEINSGSMWTDFYTMIEALEEPQFHIIRPILPRFDTLLDAVRHEKLGFIWLRIALLRAILHTNGWIRVWAIEKSVSIDAEILQRNHEFITSMIIPNLNNNDVFWRHLEKNQMDLFLRNLTFVFDSLKSSREFLQNLLLSIESMTCPTAIFFVVSALHDGVCCPTLTSDDVALMRRAVLRARYIPHKSMRICTIRNLVVFYAKVTVLNEIVLEELANIIAYFSNESTDSMVDSTFQQIQQVLISTKYKCSENHNEQVFAQKFWSSKNIKEQARMWWLAMGDDESVQRETVQRLQLEVAGALPEQPPRDLSIQLFLLKERPQSLKICNDVMVHCKDDFGEYLMTKIISSDGSAREFQLLKNLYAPLFIKFCPQLILPFGLAVMRVLSGEELQKTCESAALLLTFIDSIVDKIDDPRDSIKLSNDFYNYLGDKHVVSMRRPKKSIEEYDTKEFNNIVATLHSLRIKLLNRFLEKVPVDSFLTECVEQLDIASAFAVKQQLCQIIAKYVGESSDTEVITKCIRACANIVNEEKKSLNSLPALECFVNVALNGLIFSPDVNEEVISLFDAQMAIANQSTPVALILVDGMTKYREKLNISWASLIIKLAIFGPVPKKEARVISFAYSKMFTEESEQLEKDQIERLDEVVQKARFKAILLAMKLSTTKYGTVWTKSLIEEIFNASAIMDQSSSRSFGLSMAHRQKTRAVELLSILASRIDDEDFAGKIFDFCITCVVDPCQQFSIKLTVEWILARLCIKFPRLFERITDKEFETQLAAQRIGSICSWLNVLMLISRAAPSHVETCLEKVIVWCTAQNFPVRCTALAASRLMFSSLDEQNQKSWTLVKNIINFDAEPSGNSKRVIDNLCSDFYFAKLHVERHFDFQTILSEIAKRTGMPPEESIPNEVVVELNDVQDQMRSLNEDSEFLQAPSEVYSALSKNASSAPSMETEDVEEEDDSDGPSKDGNSASFQRKICKDSEIKNDDVSLIVVASLVDKPNNLGGICRTSEIFGVDTLVVSDVLFALDSSFKALSMSSENWQKIEGVKPANLLGYLQNLRANGYTVIAVEQTTDSVMMHDFVFPKKAVIVMGDEKEGVPVNLLRAVDQTVEIKQIGHTRSLNVHVTAALMIAKFAEQVQYSKN